MPLGIWAAIRLSVLVTVATLVLIAGLAIRYLVSDVYPYGSSSPQAAVWATQEFLSIVAVVSIGLSVLLAEIRQQNAKLELRIRERTSSLARANTELNAANERLQVTVSLGLVQWDGKQYLDELVHAADKALYAAKHDGRNCVRLSASGTVRPLARA